jgi:hypothetical protein
MAIEEYIPRRLRRFYRKQKKEGVKELQTSAASQIFEQLKKEQEEKRPSRKKTEKEVHLYRDKYFKKGIGKKLMEEEISNFTERFGKKPSKEELNQIAENIFEQLKKTNVLNEKPSTSKEKEKKSNEIKEMFSEESNKTSEEKEFDLKELEKEFSIESEDQELLSITGKEKENEKNNFCPSCKNKTSKIKFCSNCGNAFCLKCAKDVKKEANITLFKCPKCGKQLKSKN